MGWVATARLVEAIYDAEAFADVVGELAQRIGARSFFGGFGLEGGLSDFAIDNGWWSAEQIALYGSAYLDHDPCVGAMLSNWRPQQVLDLERLIGGREFEHSLLYQDFIRPMGDDTFRALGVPFELAGGKGAVTFQRGIGQAKFSEEEKAALERFAPALAQLFAARGKIVALENTAQRHRGLADSFGRPMMNLTSAGRLVEANAAGSALLKAGQVLELHEGFVRPPAIRMRQSFKDALSAIAAQPGAGMSGLRLTRPDAPPDEAIALPQMDGTILLEIMPAAAPDLSADLQRIYGLSPSESQVATLLCDGHSIGEIAELRNVSIHTVRLQVRSVAAKMGCSRQVDIVRRIAALPRYHSSQIQ